jgi:hypothetical protein
MDNLTPTEIGLRGLFESVALQVPDAPAESWAQVEAWDAEIDELLPPTRRRTIRRSLLGAGVVLAALGIATGVAAATNSFPFDTSADLGSALAILSSPRPQSQPGTTVEATTPGPEGTVLRVVSALGNNTAYHVAECAALVISLPDGSPAPGSLPHQVGCDAISSATKPLTPAQQVPGSGQQVAQWTAPSGTEYNFIFGQATAGTDSVALTNTSGAVGAKVAVNSKGWFVVYETTAEYEYYGQLTFIDSSGHAAAYP